MNILLLVLSIIFIFAYGYWLMARLDRYTCSKRSGNKQDHQVCARPWRTLIASFLCKMHHI